MARPPKLRGAGVSTGRAAASALRIANGVGAALAKHRELGYMSSAPLFTGALVLAALAFNQTHPLGAFE